jgi:hypothetical protein
LFLRARGPLLAVLLLASLAACNAMSGLASTAPTASPTTVPTTSDPQGTVRLGIAAVTDHDYRRLQDLTCREHRSSALGPFVGASALSELTSLGVSERDVFAATEISYADVTTEEFTRSEKLATVRWSGTGTVTYDKAKFRALMKRAARDQKVKKTDAELDAAIAQFPGEESHPINSLIDLEKKGKAWLIC